MVSSIQFSWVVYYVIKSHGFLMWEAQATRFPTAACALDLTTSLPCDFLWHLCHHGLLGQVTVSHPQGLCVGWWLRLFKGAAE